jgi:phosphatidylserine/phosphatidylglycerophosphate/cardiolipin synthase-like enzyme
VKILPAALVETVVARLEGGDSADRRTLSERILLAIPSAHQRDLVGDFFREWRTHAAEVNSSSVAAALLAASLANDNRREEESLELVWTGPDADAGPIRRTEQVILEVIDSASQRVTMVSYAVYSIPHICGALVRAAGRGVRINVIVETPDKLEGKNEYNTLLALGPEVAACSTVYYWPKQNRGVDANGKLGILHVKCVAADGRWLFLSSANLTDYAFSINMELGLLARGGALPGRVEKHFDRLIERGVLARL